MTLAVGSPDLMQRLPRLPSTPNLTLIDRRKSKPPLSSHSNTTFPKQIYIRWCCIDLSNAPPLPSKWVPVPKFRVTRPVASQRSTACGLFESNGNRDINCGNHILHICTASPTRSQ